MGGVRLHACHVRKKQQTLIINLLFINVVVARVSYTHTHTHMTSCLISAHEMFLVDDK